MHMAGAKVRPVPFLPGVDSGPIHQVAPERPAGANAMIAHVTRIRREAGFPSSLPSNIL